jgi:hypothetical protein
LRAPGILDYRKSDLNGAIADLNKAVQFDPRSLATAYIDHRTIFYRLRKFERALAGVTATKRIENASRSISAPKEPRFDQAAIAVTPSSQRRAAAQDARENKVVSGR